MHIRHLLPLFALWLLCWSGPVAGNDPKQQAKLDEDKLGSASLPTDGPGLLKFFRLRTLPDAERVKYQNLIRELGAPAFRTREQAAGVLFERGPVLMNVLRECLKDEDVEIARRCEKLIARLQEKVLPTDVTLAAVRHIAVQKPSDTVETLLNFLPFADNDAIAEEVRTSLTTLAKRDGKTDAVLVAALADKNAIRRSAAGEALVRADAVDQKAAVRKLLEDTDPLVRLRVASALAYAKERQAIPVLIDLLASANQAHAWQVEDILYRLGEGSSPPQISLGSDEPSRKKARDAWEAWWKEKGEKIDLARLRDSAAPLNYTLMVMLDLGQVIEVDNSMKNKERWKVAGLMFPLDVQLIGDDRLLVAEYHAQRVTERDVKTNEIKWTYTINSPQVAQRLPNGNTYIGTDTQLLEIDRDQKVVFTHTLLNGERVMKSMKLPNNQIVCLTDGARVVRFDGAGKEIDSFNVQLGTRLFGGRLHALPNGRVLIPHNGENKVVEYDTKGKVVWEVAIDQPVAATRLPNGNTLVTTMQQNRAVEFDRNGREVWEYKTDTRVTRAMRR